MTDTLLAVRNLSVTYSGDDGDVRAVRNVSFTSGRERLGIVGESGSGKSHDRARHHGSCRPVRPHRRRTNCGFDGTDLRGLGERGMRASCAASASPW